MEQPCSVLPNSKPEILKPWLEKQKSKLATKFSGTVRNEQMVEEDKNRRNQIMEEEAGKLITIENKRQNGRS